MTNSNSPNDPPAYDEFVEQPPAFKDVDVKAKAEPEPEPRPHHQPSPLYTMIPGPSSYQTQPIAANQTPLVYRYVNAATGEQVASLLPPNHPEMVCLQTGHIPHTNYGVLGILAAVFWFPLGVGLCLLDRQVKCSRCGATIEEAFCH